MYIKELSHYIDKVTFAGSSGSRQATAKLQWVVLVINAAKPRKCTTAAGIFRGPSKGT